jgi:cell division initiation protein
MRISPLDIRKQSFKKSMRGVDTEEVRIFLELVASEYEKVLQENAMMAEKLRYQDDRLGEYRELEKSMRNSLVTADRIASESRDSSEREATRVVQDAHLRAERILEDARERLQGLIREIEALKGKKEIYARRFWALVESQLSVLQEHMQDEGEVDSLRRRVEHLVADTGRSSLQEPSAEAAEPSPPSRPLEEQSPASQLAGEHIHVGRGASEPMVGLRPAPEAPTPASGWSPPPPIRLRVEGNDRIESEPEESQAKRGLPRGLGRLLRGRQANLPLDGDSTGGKGSGAAREESATDDRGGFFPIRERREGFVEIRAREGLDGDGRESPDPAKRPPPRERS